MAVKTKQRPRTATHRPAVRRRRFRHDDHTAVDLFSGFDVPFLDHPGTFIVWGTARDQVGEWIGARLRAILHGDYAAA